MHDQGPTRRTVPERANDAHAKLRPVLDARHQQDARQAPSTIECPASTIEQTHKVRNESQRLASTVRLGTAAR